MTADTRAGLQEKLDRIKWNIEVERSLSSEQSRIENNDSLLDIIEALTTALQDHL